MWIKSILCLLYLTLQLQDVASRKLERVMEHERLLVKYADYSYGNVSLHIGKANKTHMGLNSTFVLKRSLDKDTRISLKFSKFDNGVYKETAVQIDKTLCEFLAGEYKNIYEMYWKKGEYMEHFFHTCPVTKGVYYTRNSGLPTLNFPYLPLWRFQVRIELSLRGKDILVVDHFGVIKEVAV